MEALFPFLEEHYQHFLKANKEEGAHTADKDDTEEQAEKGGKSKKGRMEDKAEEVPKEEKHNDL